MNIETTLRYAVNIIDPAEGLALIAYLDRLANPPRWTIGHGTTRIDGNPVTEGMTCSKDQADAWRGEDMREALHIVLATIHVPLNEYHAAALTSLCYNIGAGHFIASDVAYALNRGLYSVAANRFLEYDHAGGVVVHGLDTRRARERACFLIGCGVITDPAFPGAHAVATVRAAISAADQLNQRQLDRIATGV